MLLLHQQKNNKKFWLFLKAFFIYYYNNNEKMSLYPILEMGPIKKEQYTQFTSWLKWISSHAWKKKVAPIAIHWNSKAKCNEIHFMAYKLSIFILFHLCVTWILLLIFGTCALLTFIAQFLLCLHTVWCNGCRKKEEHALQ